MIQSAILVSIFGSRRSYHYHRDQGQLELVSYVLMITMGVAMLISAITSASLTCRPLCCSPTKQGVVHYRPNNQVNQVSEANATSVVLSTSMNLENSFFPLFKTCKPSLPTPQGLLRTQARFLSIKMLLELEVNTKSSNPSYCELFCLVQKKCSRMYG